MGPQRRITLTPLLLDIEKLGDLLIVETLGPLALFSSGNKYIIVIIDAVIRYVVYQCAKKVNSGEVLHVLEKWTCERGIFSFVTFHKTRYARTSKWEGGLRRRA